MAHSINLVPQDEVFEQAKSRVVRFSTIFSILLLVIVGLITFYLNSQRMALTSDLNTLNTKIDNLRSEIQSLSAIEITARTLDKRYNVLSGIYDEQEMYSRLLSEVAARTPEGIVVVNFNIRDQQVEISGEGDNYLEISAFTTNLLDENFENGTDGMENLFTTVSLNSVNLRGKEGKVDFALVVSFDKGLLLK